MDKQITKDNNKVTREQISINGQENLESICQVKQETTLKINGQLA